MLIETLYAALLANSNLDNRLIKGPLTPTKQSLTIPSEQPQLTEPIEKIILKERFLLASADTPMNSSGSNDFSPEILRYIKDIESRLGIEAVPGQDGIGIFNNVSYESILPGFDGLRSFIDSINAHNYDIIMRLPSDKDNASVNNRIDKFIGALKPKLYDIVVSNGLKFGDKSNRTEYRVDIKFDGRTLIHIEYSTALIPSISLYTDIGEKGFEINHYNNEQGELDKCVWVQQGASKITDATPTKKGNTFGYAQKTDLGVYITSDQKYINFYGKKFGIDEIRRGRIIVPDETGTSVISEKPFESYYVIMQTNFIMQNNSALKLSLK